MRRAPPTPEPEACWRELMAAVLDGPLCAEQRLEALIDHIERGPPRPAEGVRGAVTAVSATVVPPSDGAPTYAALDLLAGRATARIVLGDQTYVLRLTRAGKLILTK